ncbi:MAG: DEAD/DEAH box helicase family protein, partial [Candidatus Odinarchaeia archaeon]
MITKTEPFEHQKECYEKAKELLDTEKYFALLLEMGTGKSKVAIDLASNLFVEGKIEAVLLIAPNGVQEQWFSQQIIEHSPVPTESILWSNKKTISNQESIKEFQNSKKGYLKWLCVNVERFSTDDKRVLKPFIEYMTNHKTMVIIDESTTI